MIFRHNEIFDTISQHYNYPLEEASIRYIESSMLIFRYDNPTLTVTSSKKAPWITPRDTLPFLVRSYLKKNKKKSICCRCCCCCCCQRRRLTALLLLDGQPARNRGGQPSRKLDRQPSRNLDGQPSSQGTPHTSTSILSLKRP